MSPDAQQPREFHRSVFSITLANRTLRLTREGAGFVCLVFGIGLAAINTGNNLLYLILAMCCSFLAVSGVLSEMTLRDIEIALNAPQSVYSGEPYPFTLTVTNHKRKAASYSLRIVFPADHPKNYQVDRDVYIYNIPPQAQSDKCVMVTAYRRGPLSIRSCRLSTSFPFGFFLKSKEVFLNTETVVFPQIKKVDLPIPGGPAMQGVGAVRARGEELFALREYRDGDAMSRVHWKSSAKTGDLRIKEYLGGEHENYTILLNLVDPQTRLPIAKDVMEQKVSESASLAYYLIRRGDAVQLKTPDYESPFANTESHLEMIMTYLAFAGLEKVK